MTLQRKKEIGLTIFVCIYGTLFFFGLASIFEPNQSWSTLLIIVLTLSAILWVAFEAVSLALVHHIGSSAALVLTPSLTVIVAGYSAFALGSGALLAIILFVADRSIAREVRSRVKYSAISVFLRGVRLMVLGLFIAAAGLSLPLVAERLSSEQIRVPEQYLEWLLAPLEPFLGNLFPGVSRDQTIDALIESRLQQQLSELSEDVTVSSAQVEQVRQQLSRQLDSELTGQEKLSTVVARLLNGYINRLTADQNSPLVPIILLVLALLAARALVPIIVWPVLAVIALTIIAAKQVGLAYVVRSQATVERLQL